MSIDEAVEYDRESGEFLGSGHGWEMKIKVGFAPLARAWPWFGGK